jgi:hypothetical protein
MQCTIRQGRSTVQGACRDALPEGQGLFPLLRPVEDERAAGTLGYRAGGLVGRAGSGTLGLGLLGVSLRRGRSGLGFVRGISPCRRSSCSRLVSGVEVVPGAAGSRSAGLVVSGTAGGRLRLSPGLACPGLLGSVPGTPGCAPGLPGAPGFPGAPGPPPGAPPPAWAHARVDARQSTGNNRASVLANVRNIESLPWSMYIMVGGVPRPAAHRPLPAHLPIARANSMPAARALSFRLRCA